MSQELIHTPHASMEYPKDWHKEVVLSDQTRATIRFARPGDANLLVSYFDGFSEEELYLRYLSRMKRKSVSRQRAIEFYKDAINNENARIIVLVARDGSLQGVCRAMERLERYRGTGTFEVSFSAKVKHRGVGTLLMSELLRWARATPTVQRLEAVTLRNNRPMRKIFDTAGFNLTFDADDPTLVQYMLQVHSN